MQQVSTQVTQLGREVVICKHGGRSDRPYGPGVRSSLQFRVYGRTINDRCGALAAFGFLGSSIFTPSLHP